MEASNINSVDHNLLRIFEIFRETTQGPWEKGTWALGRKTSLKRGAYLPSGGCDLHLRVVRECRRPYPYLGGHVYTCRSWELSWASYNLDSMIKEGNNACEEGRISL